MVVSCGVHARKKLYSIFYDIRDATVYSLSTSLLTASSLRILTALAAAEE